MFERKKPVGRVVALPVEQIEPSPFQARRTFDEAELAGLAASIRENGLLQPVTVRRLGPDRYELVAGERRLRACKLAGMDKVPAIVRDCEDKETAALGLLENIQRADLNPFEQARGLQDILALWDCTQAEAARRLGMAQPTLANKLRLLQLTPDQQKFILDSRLTERHARAVLRLPENRRSEALIYISAHKLNARAADRYVEQLLNAPPRPPRRRLPMVKDVRIFVNTIDHAIRLMTDNGVPATARREEGDGYIEYNRPHPHGDGRQTVRKVLPVRTAVQAGLFAWSRLDRRLCSTWNTCTECLAPGPRVWYHGSRNGRTQKGEDSHADRTQTADRRKRPHLL